MITVARATVLLLLGTAVWQVYQVRGRLAAEDADPAAVAALRASLDSLPLHVAHYSGEPEPVDPDIVEQSGADSYASVRYGDGEGNSFRVYIGGSIRNRENFHAPAYCMPAAGWEILNQTVVPFEAYRVEDAEPVMRRLLLQRGSERMLVYYWFQAGSRIASHEWTIRYYRFLDLLAQAPFRPTLIVTVYAPVANGVEDTESATREFLQAVGPVLRSAIVTGEHDVR